MVALSLTRCGPRRWPEIEVRDGERLVEVQPAAAPPSPLTVLLVVRVKGGGAAFSAAGFRSGRGALPQSMALTKSLH